MRETDRDDNWHACMQACGGGADVALLDPDRHIVMLEMR
jgi:hypothetical protein